MREKLIELVKQGYNKYFNPNWALDLFALIADHLIANGVTLESYDCHWATEQAYKNGYADAMASIVRCKDCKHWLHMGDGFGDCTNGRFHLDGHADPTMKADDYCSCGERREGNG